MQVSTLNGKRLLASVLGTAIVLSFSTFAYSCPLAVQEMSDESGVGQEKQDDEDGGESKGDESPPKKPEKKAPPGTSIGEKIKDIIGEDVEGEEFSLSDYEGKVIMLDFWGDW